MLIDMKRMAAYICPECSNAVMGKLSVFNFSGGNSVKLICPADSCGAHCASVYPYKNKKFKIDVFCPFCGRIHSNMISQDKFWQRDLTSFSCPETDIDMFFAGSLKSVEQALNHTLKECEELYGDFDNDLDEDGILYEILDVIYELYHSGSVSCVCGCETVNITPSDNGVRLTCPRCRRSKTIEATKENLAMILNSTAIVLGK